MTRRSLFLLWRLCAFAIIALAVLVSLLRLVWTQTHWIKPHAEAYLSERTGTQITIEELGTEWRVFGPELRVKGLRLLRPADRAELLSVREFHASLDFWRSFFTIRPVMRRFQLDGLQTGVTLDENGQPRLVGLEISGGGEDASAKWVIDSLLRQRQVRITDTRLRYVRKRGDAIDLQISELSLTRFKEHHEAQGDLQVQNGGHAQVRAAFTDYPLAEKDWLRFSVKGDALDVAKLPFGLQSLGVDLHSGTLGLELNAAWREGRWQHLQSQFSFADVTLRNARGSSFSPMQIRGGLRMQAYSHGPAVQWLWQSTPLQVTQGAQQWPDAQLQGRVVRAGEHWQAQFDLQDLQLERVLSLALFSDKVDAAAREKLEALQVRAGLPVLQFDWSQTAEQAPQWAAAVQFQDLQYQDKQLPVVNGLNGRVLLSESEGKARLNGSALSLDFHNLFRQTLALDSLDVAAAWQINTDGAVVQVPQVLARYGAMRVEAQARVDVPREGEAEMTLAAGVEGLDAAQKSRYLPAGIMEKELVSWLDAAVEGGALPRARALVRGPLSAFPFAHDDGVFIAEGDLQNARLRFQPAWPALQNLNAHLHFTGQDMTVKIHNTQTEGGVQASNGEARLPLLADGVLEVDAHVQGQLAGAMQYLRASPLQQSLSGLTDVMTVDGAMHGELGLRIPLADADGATVKGRVAFSDLNGVLSGPDLHIQHLRGEVHYNEAGVSAGAIEADLLGGAVRAEITGDASGGRLQLQGDTQAEVLQEWLPHPLAPFITGKFAWTGDLRLPARDSGLLRLRLETDTTGLRAELPAPYGKPDDQARESRFSYELNGGREIMQAQYGEDVAFQSRREKGSARHAEILLGGTPYAGHREGLTVRGRLQKAEAEPWIALVNKAVNIEPAVQIAALDGGAKTEAPSVSPALALDIAEVDLYGIPLTNVQIGGSGVDAGYRVQVRSAETEGEVKVQRGAPLAIRLEHFRHAVPAEDASGGEGEPAAVVRENLRQVAQALRPADWPDVRFLCKQCTFFGRDFGRIDAEVNSDKTDKLLSVTLQREGLLNGALSARWSDAERQTRLQGEVTSPDLGKLLSDWRWDIGIRDSDASLNVDLTWPGSPAAIRMRELNGNLLVKLGRGYIAQDSGSKERVARVFSLFSLQSITRRLSLDFTDLFREGFFYDDLRGSFAVAEGVARTEDTRMRGVSADIEIRGQTDLATRTLDQRVQVTPKLSSSLPVIAGWAINPPAAIVVWLMNKLFIEPAVKVVTGIEYTVQGTWDAPDIREEKRTEGEVTVKEEPQASTPQK